MSHLESERDRFLTPEDFASCSGGNYKCTTCETEINESNGVYCKACYLTCYCSLLCKKNDWNNHKGCCILLRNTARGRHMQIYHTVIAGKVEELEDELKEDPATIENWHEERTTLLIAACAYGNVATAKWLANYDPSVVPFQVPVNGYTALMAASMIGYLDVVDLLLQFHATVNVYSNLGMTALSAACRCGHTRIAEHLLQHNADLDCVDNRGFTSIIHAISGGHEAVLAVLLKYNGNVNTRDNQGFTGLMYAVMRNQMNIVQMILQYASTDINVKNMDGSTALILACIDSSEPMVEILLQHHADVNIQPKDIQDTALIAACHHGNLDIIRSLLKAGADIDAIGTNGNTALINLSANGHHNSCRELLKYKPETVHTRNSDGKTALDLTNEHLERFETDLNVEICQKLIKRHTTLWLRKDDDYYY